MCSRFFLCPSSQNHGKGENWELIQFHATIDSLFCEFDEWNGNYTFSLLLLTVAFRSLTWIILPKCATCHDVIEPGRIAPRLFLAIATRSSLLWTALAAVSRRWLELMLLMCLAASRWYGETALMLLLLLLVFIVTIAIFLCRIISAASRLMLIRWWIIVAFIVDVVVVVNGRVVVVCK